MSTLPLPVRVAVGLAITAVEQARKLPEQLSGLPVTAASRAVQAAMRVQQRVTELAIKGDQVCALLRPVQEAPPWAHFDEDDESGATATLTATSRFDENTDDTAFAAVVSGPGGGHGATTKMSGEVDEADVARAMTSVCLPEDARPEDTRPEYDELSLAQLRGKLRSLSLSELTELLEYEHAHSDRAAFITMLSNRISTVRSHSTESQ